MNTPNRLFNSTLNTLCLATLGLLFSFAHSSNRPIVGPALITAVTVTASPGTSPELLLPIGDGGGAPSVQSLGAVSLVAAIRKKIRR